MLLLLFIYWPLLDVYQKKYVSNHYDKAVGEKAWLFSIDLFSMYALVSQCRSCDSILGNCFIQIIHCIPFACINIISFMKRQRSNFLWDLHWDEKKHIQATCNEVYSSSKKWLLTLVSFILLKSSLFCHPFLWTITSHRRQ